MRGKYQKRGNRVNWFKRHKILTAVLLILLLLIGTVVGYIWSKLNLIQYADEIREPRQTDGYAETTSPGETEEAQLVDISGLEYSETEPVIPEAEIEKKDEVLNILLIGTDERTKSFSTNARSDSMIIVSINKDKKTVKLVSLERGMGAPVLEGEYEGQYDWLTHIFRYGGADLLVKTVEHCFRVEIDNYVRVNFTTVTQVVDAIGGIDIELNSTEAWHLNRTNDAIKNFRHPQLQEGTNHISGEVALHLARLRSIDSDWQRVERQRRVITACVGALKGSSLKDLNNLLDEVLPLVQTDLTMLEIADLMLYAPNFLTSTFDQMTIPKEGTYGGMTGMGGRGLFAVDFEVNSDILKEFLYGEE